MKQTTNLNTTQVTSKDVEKLQRDFQDLPEMVRIRPIRSSRYHMRGGLPIDELERISTMRLWEALAGIPVNRKYPDDFEPALPSQDGLGRCGE